MMPKNNLAEMIEHLQESKDIEYVDEIKDAVRNELKEIEHVYQHNRYEWRQGNNLDLRHQVHNELSQLLSIITQMRDVFPGADWQRSGQSDKSGLRRVGRPVRALSIIRREAPHMDQCRRMSGYGRGRGWCDLYERPGDDLAMASGLSA